MIVSTDAIVLRAMKYGDTSRIVTLYTRDFGKVSVIAKGARGPRGRYGAALEPMSVSHAVYYRKENRDLQMLSQADLIRQFTRMLADAERLMAGFAVIEYVHAVIHGEEEHAALYDTVLDALEGIDASARPLAVLLGFLLGLCTSLGFHVTTASCIGCGLPLDDEVFSGRMAFDSELGGIACPACTRLSRGRAVDAEICRAIRDGAHADPARHVLESALRILHQHLASHVGGLREMHSLELLARTSG